MTITPFHLASIALDVWRSHGARTERRRELLLMSYAETYYGVHLQWTEDQRATVDAARLLTRQRTRIDELTYELPGTDRTRHRHAYTDVRRTF